MTTIRGLHSCKVGNTPYVGDVKTFLVQELTGKSGKAYTKIRSASQQDGGRPYEVMSVAKTDYTDAHGNLSFNIEIVPVTIPEDRSKAAVPVQTTTQTSGNMPAARPNGVGYEDRGNRIERQHSQEMAIRYIALRFATGVPEGVDIKSILRDMIDWFQRDVSRVPAAPKAKAKLAEPASEPYDMADEHPDNQSEEEF